MPKLIVTVAVFFIISLPINLVASSLYRDVTIEFSDNTGLAFTVNFDEIGEYITFIDRDSSTVIVKKIMIGYPSGSAPVLASVTGSRSRYIPDTIRAMNFGSSPDLARIEKTEKIRGKNIATIVIYPADGMSYYSSVRVEMKFVSSGGQNSDITISVPDPVFDKVLGYMVLNYDRARDWNERGYDDVIRGVEQSPFAPAGSWFKMQTANQGLIKVTAAQLRAAGTLPTTLYSDSLHLYYGGGMPLAVSNSVPRPEFKEIPIRVFDGDDGIFGGTDYFLFYGEAAQRWRYPSDSAPYYLNNAYTDYNYYWLAVSGDFLSGGIRMSSIDGTPDDPSATVVDRTTRYTHEESDRILFKAADNHEYDWYNWFWSNSVNVNISAFAPGAIAGTNAEILVRAVSRSVTSLRINNVAATPAEAGYNRFRFSTGSISGSYPLISITMDSAFSPAKAAPHLDYCEIKYTGYLVPVNNELDFMVNEFDGNGEFWVTDNFSQSPYIFDITDPSSPRLVIGAQSSGGTLKFQSMVSTSGTRFYLSVPSKTYGPAAIEQIHPVNLRENYSQTDLMVISPRVFLEALDEYVTYRADKSGLTVRSFALEDIMNEFSYGQYDPTAIRDFLKFAYENYPDPKPSAVLLVGDGSYDFKNRLGTAVRNYVPPYVMADYDSTSSDDNYVYFGDYGILDSDTTYNPDTPGADRGYDMIVARWPVRGISEIQTIVDKVKTYESAANFGKWRTVVTLVADDEYGSSSVESIHVRQTETLSNYHVPPQFYRNKIYLWEYPFDFKGDKPGVNQKIIESINNGTLLVNFVGHGNPDTWAHEHVFNRTSDLAQLRNADRLTLVFTASCSIGFFDDPQREGMAEDLIRLPGGGAVATVAATRLVYASQNAEFNRAVFNVLFGGESLSICQAVYIGKLLRQYGSGYIPYKRDNDRAYVFFGDPFLQLGIPKHEVTLYDYPDTLAALNKYDISGAVTLTGSGTAVDFDGSLEITVYDSELKKKYIVYNSQGGINDSVSYAITGPRIYSGRTDVVGGEFAFSFITPLDIGYGGQGAKISTYAASGLVDALGLADSLAVDKTITGTSDNEGPDIAYTFSERENFISGDNVSVGEALILTISDESGVNLTSGAGHEISLIIDNRLENIINLTDLFTYMTDSYTTGRVVYQMDELAIGRHSFKVKAWDNANNSSMVDFEANVVEAGQMIMTDLLNYPNPMHESTVFSFSLSSPAQYVRLEIFTLSGKKILGYNKHSVPAGFQEFFTWDGRDADRDRVATGTYIYKATAVSESSGDRVESFGKVVVIN